MSSDAIHDSPSSVGSPFSRVLWVVALGLAAVLFFGGLLALPFSSVAGTEFNATTLEERRFHYYRIPFTQIGISPVTREVSQPDWARFLSSKGYWKAAKQGGRWDLVEVTLYGDEGDASVLITLLDVKDEDGRPFWETWTNQHPQTGKLLWERVRRAALLDLYPYTTVLLQMARRHPDPDAFDKFSKGELDDLLQHDLRQARQHGNSDRIRRLAEFGLVIWPDSKLWKSHAKTETGSS